jgi:hypothetical protein
MLKLKIKLYVQEIKINEEYCGRGREIEKSVIEKEIDEETKDRYEEISQEEDLIEKCKLITEIIEKERNML